MILRRLDWRIPVALLATYVSFGSGPAAVASAIKGFPPLLMVSTRGVIAGTILTLWALYTGAERPRRGQWRAAALIGFLILTCGAGAGTYGQLTVASGVAGVLSALLPLFAACIGYILFREKLARPATVGLVIGFAGVGILLRPGSGFDLLGVGVIVLGQLAWALGAELPSRRPAR
jgi:drug/metabolite transporter (DMT)-like permease